MRIGHIMTRVLGLTVLVCVAVGVGAQVRPLSPPAEVVDPVVVLWRVGDLGTPSGLLLAAWSDGTVLATDNPDDPGSTLRLGVLPSEQTGSVLEAILESELARLPSAQYLVPDAAAYKVGLRFGDTTKVYQWDEVIHPNYGANIQATEQYIEFAGAWTRCRIRLLGLYQSDRSHAAEVGSGDPYFVAAGRAAGTWAGSKKAPAPEAGQP